jgi:hypothetical protein
MAIVPTPNLFAVLADPQNLVLERAITSAVPGEYIQIRPGQWFVVSTGTARELSDKLGVTPGNASGAAVIVAVSGYYGRASTEIWEWVKAKIGAPQNV